MKPTQYKEINELLSVIILEMQNIFGKNLVGIYLYGSLVTGDFDMQCSDIDLLAVTTHTLNSQEFKALDILHKELIKKYIKWENRIEIAYLSADALQTCQTQKSKIAVISPGEEFHVKEAGKEWLVNWYIVREHGISLFGPSPSSVIPEISKSEFLQTVKDHAMLWKKWITDVRTRPSQAYAIITLCRALYTCKNGKQFSKKKAALWAEKELPEWSPLIRNALVWRKKWNHKNINHEQTLPETVQFVSYVISLIENK